MRKFYRGNVEIIRSGKYKIILNSYLPMAKAWKEQVVIPTYEAGTPEKNPIFLEKRVYQGSSGVVYPYPVIEKIADEKTDHTYNAVFLENEYIKVMVLPELGARWSRARHRDRISWSRSTISAASPFSSPSRVFLSL